MPDLPDLDADFMRFAEAEMREERLRAFVRESNRIEGVLDDPNSGEMLAHRELMHASRMTVALLEGFVDLAVRPTNDKKPKLRVRKGQNVSIVDRATRKVLFQALPGGPEVELRLRDLLDQINAKELSPAKAHYLYETLHPFTDGNGRSGRALWAWMMRRIGKDPFALPFLHRFYYQSIEESRA